MDKGEGTIPYIPVKESDVYCIQLNGLSTRRNATDEEVDNLISIINGINKYDKRLSIPVGNGKPSSKANIQLITNDTIGSNYLYIEYYDDDEVLIGRPSSKATYGYIVKQEYLSKFLQQMQTSSDFKAV